MEGRRSAFFGIRYSHQRQRTQCATPVAGCSACGAADKREGGWAPSPQRSCSGQGDFSPCREGASALARTTSPHPPRRSPGQRNATNQSAGMHTHAPHPDQPRTTPSLTTLLAPCLADRVVFASTSDYLASAPIDGLEAGEARKPSTGSRSSSTCTAGQK